MKPQLKNVAIIKIPSSKFYPFPHPMSYLICTIYPDNNGYFKGEIFVIFSKIDSSYDLIIKKFCYELKQDENYYLKKVINNTTFNDYIPKLRDEIKNLDANKVTENMSLSYKHKLDDEINNAVKEVEDAIKKMVEDNNNIIEELEPNSYIIEHLKIIHDKTEHTELKEYLEQYF